MADIETIGQQAEAFRDSVATITKEGKRNFIHTKKPKGSLYNLRAKFSIFYLVTFFTLPFIKVHGEPLLMFNILQRKFIIFGLTFWPQDFFIFGIAMLTFIVFVILFTVVFGRAFCGWACPQNIFLELVFRKIEYWINGDATQQKQLKALPWNADKIRKRTTKSILFFSLSFLIANFFLAYMIGMDQLLNYVLHPGENMGTLVSLLLFTAVSFAVYWWFREQACIVGCPYGRVFVMMAIFITALAIGAMWCVSFFGSMAGFGVRSAFKKIYPYLMFAVAGLLILRGLGLEIPYVSPGIHVQGDGLKTTVGCHENAGNP